MVISHASKSVLGPDPPSVSRFTSSRCNGSMKQRTPAVQPGDSEGKIDATDPGGDRESVEHLFRRMKIMISLQQFSHLTVWSSSYTRRVLMNLQETFAKGHCCTSLWFSSFLKAQLYYTIVLALLLHLSCLRSLISTVGCNRKFWTSEGWLLEGWKEFT